jgi:integration host factor subunit beta
MTKSDLIYALAEKEYLSGKNATDIITLVSIGFTDALKKGDRIEIRTFGSFSLRQYGSYKGRDC